MIDRKALLSDLQAQVKAAETDLEGQVKREDGLRDRLRAEYEASKKVGRTAATWQSWLDERITQVAVAWVLGTVFIRFVEDNGLVPEPYITAPDIGGREVAQARYDEYVDKTEDPTYRGWFERAFEELAEGPAGALLFSDHNPLRQIPLSHEGAGALRDFWQRTVDDEAGTSVLVHDFTDPLEEDGDGTRGWDTRFLGDLYQDLSEAARKNYALLQTPEFVEEFILDRTMKPVVRERGGVEGLKMIDPTCGSGHFVLGAFRRLVREWAERRPELDPHARVRGALESVHGVDINPFAVAIARFRLLIAAMAAAGVRTLGEAAGYDWPVQLAVGDSLIKPRQVTDQLFTSEADPLAEFKYATEDIQERSHLLDEGRYDVVVGNPPYITVKDKQLNRHYRELYDACSGKYALSVPFAQRFFELAKKGGADGKGYGVVGQITSNSFMKREFGTKLIESFFRDQVELTEVIDTSGTYIPGHGTPTVILVGRNRDWTQRRGDTIRTVRSVQGEPSAPEDPEQGLVWSAIVEQIDEPGSVSQWVSVGDLDRGKYFGAHPWVLAAGGREMIDQLNAIGSAALGSKAARLGVFGMTNADDIMLTTRDAWLRRGCDPSYGRDLALGDEIRDWSDSGDTFSFFPYSDSLHLLPLQVDSGEYRWLWPGRTSMGNRATFSRGTYFSDGRTWYEWHQTTPSPGAHPWTITFAEVATHNHFLLDRGGKVFKQTAPVIKLREEATEEDHVQLLGVLNSSTAAFWLKMVCHNKGSTVDSRGARQSTIPFEDFYQFNGTNVQDFPLPPSYPTELATALDTLAGHLAFAHPAAVAAAGSPTAATLREARATYEATRARMIALQEELDWQVYSLYGLTDTDLRPADPADVPPLALGERAFEIVLARAIERGEASSEWFTRHNSTPITELPDHWPAAYKEIVNQRIAMMESNSAIGMVERPEYKRRWATDGWDAMQKRALRAWLLDRIEAKRELWFDGADQPTLITLPRLTDRLQEDDDFAAVLNLYAPRADFAKTVAELVGDQHVPAAAALRYKPAGLKKRADWERTWEMQRKEDAATSEDEKRKIRAATDVPPKYASADFLRTSFWAQRGKLDVPKERFISYGAHNTQTPALLGWAGWDHLQQAQAIVGYLNENELTPDELTPYLAALLELQLWLDQWHGEYLPDFGQSAAQAFHDFRLALQGEHGLTDDDLRAWRPAAAARGRRAKKTK
ncbi:DNA methylase [Streptomyces sp. CNQ-509]|uniref:BREX-2 system adenine-specific DNA-methyltransferase PglX n=1 Tax=Streptomyces sp. CNQ-509 TaxID=444103 RepID=UPI00062DCC79|nr:BREX-2 system adenine-specific DNA-methyltransferase PglX [Streptomyces sp. CNQ-509]AKH82112.1 DNA methylase [Streptomyces sp. CNQ-509]